MDAHILAIHFNPLEEKSLNYLTDDSIHLEVMVRMVVASETFYAMIFLIGNVDLSPAIKLHVFGPVQTVARGAHGFCTSNNTDATTSIVSGQFTSSSVNYVSYVNAPAIEKPIQFIQLGSPM